MAEERNRDEEILLGEEEVGTDATIPPEEEMTAAPTGDIGAESIIVHTADEIAELADKNVGDTVMLRIVNVRDDGSFELTPVAEAAEPPAAPSPAEAGVGRNAVAQELL
jgi:hypothetical protein